MKYWSVIQPWAIMIQGLCFALVAAIELKKEQGKRGLMRALLVGGIVLAVLGLLSGLASGLASLL